MSVPFASPTILNVNTDKIIRQNVNHWIGIDLNYIRDNDMNRPDARPLVTALKEMGVKWLRYPGGEKSDFQLFAKPPYIHADPVSLGWYATVKGVRMNFDEYIACCRKAGAEPFVVVGCDNQKRTGLTWDQWQKNAVEWVRYANIVKHYHVKYWEIGNENWANNTAASEEMAAIVTRFSKAMKAMDPSIHIGASASGWDGWVRPFLAGASKAVDFLTVSDMIMYCAIPKRI
jgi:alpha-L-arabinofuranosidase